MNDTGLAETHVSWLVFTADRVYKIKKPVVFGFLDLSTPEARAQACRAEVDLNSRLAPDVYEGVGTFHHPDGRVEPIVVMKRLPAEKSLTELLRTDHRDLRSYVQELATKLAEFHRTARHGPDIEAACTGSAVSALWRQNLAELRTVAEGILGPANIDEADALAHGYISGRGSLFDDRIAAGQAVEGHGDLLCDDIFCLRDGTRILDCLEFSPVLRYLDTLSDLTSLAMDLERHGRPDLVSVFLDEYREQSGDQWPSSLADFYVAYRATVRAKVACIRASSGSPESRKHDAADAEELLALALGHLRRSQIRLVLIGGLPGTGKSSLAQGIQAETEWRVLSSDVLRKRMSGVDPAEPARALFGSGLYRPEMTATMYAELLREAETLLQGGYSVILDASWLYECWRDAAHEVADRSHAGMTDLLCTTPTDLATQRIVARTEAGSGVSDATPTVADAMATLMEPWNQAKVIDTSGLIGDSVGEALELIGTPR